MQSNLLKTFKGLSGYKWDYWTLWTDFIEMMAVGRLVLFDWEVWNEDR